MKLFIFDLDGTLLNTLCVIAENSNFALKKYGYKPIEPEKYTSFIGNGARVLIERVSEYRNVDADLIDEIYNAFLVRYIENPLGDTKVYEGITEILEKFKARGAYLAVLTNKPDGAAQSSIDAFFREGLFDMVIGQQEKYKRKPDPETVDVILNNLNISKSEAVLIGDSDVDIKTGKNAGIKTCAVTWGYVDKKELVKLNPDVIIDEVCELEKLIDEE